MYRFPDNNGAVSLVSTAGAIDIFNVRRIEEDYFNYFVFYGNPQTMENLSPVIISKSAGQLVIKII